MVHIWQVLVLLAISLFWVTGCADKKPVQQAVYTQNYNSYPAISVAAGTLPQDVYQILFAKLNQSRVFEAVYPEAVSSDASYRVEFVYSDSAQDQNKDKAYQFNSTQFSLAPVKSVLTAQLNAVIYKNGTRLKEYNFTTQRDRKSSGFTKIKDDRTALIHKLGHQFLQTVTQDGVFQMNGI